MRHEKVFRRDCYISMGLRVYVLLVRKVHAETLCEIKLRGMLLVKNSY